jgi:hypothetical protein
MATINEKTWREQTVENVGQSHIINVPFYDTKPNYILLTNPCPSPLYISTSPSISSTEADMIIPPNGRQLFSQAFGTKELFILCYDAEVHKVRVKSWEGEFDPNTISTTKETVPQSPDLTLGNVVVTNLPTSTEISNDAGNPVPVSGTVGINNLPATQQIAGEVSVSNIVETVNADYLTKLDTIITLLTQIEANTHPIA